MTTLNLKLISHRRPGLVYSLRSVMAVLCKYYFLKALMGKCQTRGRLLHHSPTNSNTITLSIHLKLLLMEAAL